MSSFGARSFKTFFRIYIVFQENIFKRKWVKFAFFKTKKFYVRRNNSKFNSIETGRIDIAHWLP